MWVKGGHHLAALQGAVQLRAWGCGAIRMVCSVCSCVDKIAKSKQVLVEGEASDMSIDWKRTSRRLRL